MESDEKCEISLARLVIHVPDHLSIEEYKKYTQTVLLYPGHFIQKEKDHTYTISDEAGNKIPNVDVETIVKCGSKEVSLNISYLRLEGLPKNLAISEIVYFKPSTKETQTLSP